MNKKKRIPCAECQYHWVSKNHGEPDEDVCDHLDARDRTISFDVKYNLTRTPRWCPLLKKDQQKSSDEFTITPFTITPGKLIIGNGDSV